MAIGGHVDAVANFASILLSEYRSGTPIHDVLNQTNFPDGYVEAGDTAFTIDIKAEGSELAGLLAVFGGVQIAFEAAVAAVFYDLQRSEHTDENLDFDLLRNLIAEPPMTLDIVELNGGSFKTIVKAIAKSPVTYTVVAAVAGIATAALHVAFPPLVIPTLVITCVSGPVAVTGAVVVQRDRKRKDAEHDRKDAVRDQAFHDLEARVGKIEQEDKDRSAKLEPAVESMEAKAAPVVNEVIDLPAAAQARPTEIVVEVPERRAA